MDNTTEKIISSLSTRERIHFSRFSKINKPRSKTNYINIYNQILKNGKLDIAELNKEFPDKSFVKFISAEKEILLEKILLSQINYHFESSIYRKIIKYILFINLMLEKGFREKANKFIRRAKELAYRYEEFSLLFLIIEIEESMYFDHGYIVNRKNLKELNNERLKIIDLINNLNEYKVIKAHIQELQLNDKHFSMTLSDYKDLPGLSLLLKEDQALSKKAKNMWAYINCLIYYLSREYTLAYQMSIKQFENYQANPKIFTLADYMQLLNNFLLFSCILKKEREFNMIMNELNKIKDKSEGDDIYIQTVKYYRTLELHHRFLRYNEANNLAIEAEGFVNIESDKIEPYDIKYLQLLIVRSYIENDNYKDANRYIQVRYKTEGFNYYESLAKLFEFMIQYKTGNSQILEYSVNSWSKITQTKRNLFRVEKILFRFFRLFDSAIGDLQKKTLLDNTIQKLKESAKNHDENFMLEDFDFIGWFEKELNYHLLLRSPLIASCEIE
jgi:hypothetical protein